MTKKKREYTPMQCLLLTLSEMVNKSGMSLREIARKLEKDGFNLYNVCAVANGKPQHLASIVKFDTYLDGILRVTGHDDYELVKKTLERISQPETYTYEEEISSEMRQFIYSSESQKYLEWAYKKYKLDKLTEEQEKIKQELKDL